MSQNTPKHTPGPWTVDILWANGEPTNRRHVKKWTKQGVVSIAEVSEFNPDAEANARLIVKAPEMESALRKLIEAAETLADQEEATLSLDETRGNQKKVTPANMFLSVGRSDIREAIAEARRLLEEN